MYLSGNISNKTFDIDTNFVEKKKHFNNLLMVNNCTA